MWKNWLMIGICLLALSLVGCSREQKGLDTVYNRETPENFTTLPEETLPPKIVVPEIPGRAVIPGAPIADYPTKTGIGLGGVTATLKPTQTQTPKP